MEQAEHSIMNDLRRRDNQTVVGHPRQKVLSDLVIDLSVLRNQRFDPTRIQNVKRNHHTTGIPLLEDVSIPVQQFRQYPALEELDSSLKGIRLAQHRRERR